MISLIFHFITYQILSHIYSNRGHTPRRQQLGRSSRGLPTVIFQRSNAAADEPIRMQASDHRTTRQPDPSTMSSEAPQLSSSCAHFIFRVLFLGGSFQRKKHACVGVGRDATQELRVVTPRSVTPGPGQDRPSE